MVWDPRLRAFLLGRRTPAKDNLNCQGISPWGFPDNELSGVNMGGDVQNRNERMRRVRQGREGKNHERMS